MAYRCKLLTIYFLYYRSMKQNLIAMLADLFNLLEVHPVQSVKYPGSGESQPAFFSVTAADPNKLCRCYQCVDLGPHYC